MPSVRVNKNNKSGYYFVTLTVKNWYYLFDRHDRWQIIADSLTYCISFKQLNLYSFVFMLNHVHLIFFSPDAAGFIRDFKKFTAKALRKNIESTEPTILKLFIENNEYQFWQKTNLPLLIESEKFMLQKENYIHTNPVRKKYVTQPQHWYWSSANPDCKLKVKSWI
jgi:REP element-mobilizing transposase RayT